MVEKELENSNNVLNKLSKIMLRRSTQLNCSKCNSCICNYKTKKCDKCGGCDFYCGKRPIK